VARRGKKGLGSPDCPLNICIHSFQGRRKQGPPHATSDAHPFGRSETAEEIHRQNANPVLGESEYLHFDSPETEGVATLRDAESLDRWKGPHISNLKWLAAD